MITASRYHMGFYTDMPEEVSKVLSQVAHTDHCGLACLYMGLSFLR